MADSTHAISQINVKPSNVLDTIRKYMLVDGFPIVVDLENSSGTRLKDKADGKEYLDFFQFFASMPLGFNHPRLFDDEFKETLMAAAANKPSNSDFYAQQMANFVEAMGRYAIPDEMTNIFLIEGGALAVENALKSAFDWKVQKNFKKGHKTELGSQIIHFREAFHGRSGYTMSLTNTDPVKVTYFPKFDWPRVTNPKITFPLEDHLDEVIASEEKAKREIKDAIAKHGDDIAGLIIEPIQGEGGDNHFRPEFFKELRRLADKYEFMLIYDEVQSGMGITGKMWAFEHFEVEPDVLAFGKKSQVCGIIAGKRVEEVEKHVFEESSRINSTFGGNLVDMVRATRYLEIIEEDNLLEHTAKMGEKMKSGLETVAEESKGMMTNVRGTGLMIAYDLPNQGKRDEMIEKMYANGLKALQSGNRSVRFRGMLDTPEEIIDKAMEVVAKSIPIK
ncbi:MAG: L-lysine 6-transaminase [Candidatus Krumholzibacteria bacterium]|nr:L-lysine 6-transaminase [Candidatus Krumholzibacteria bacterium]